MGRRHRWRTDRPEAARVTAPWIGRPLRRFEDHRLLAGQGQYVDDVKIPDAYSVSLHRSPYPHARLTSIDVEAAWTARGVIDVVTGADVRGLGNVDVAPFVPNVLKPEHPLGKLSVIAL